MWSLTTSLAAKEDWGFSGETADSKPGGENTQNGFETTCHVKNEGVCKDYRSHIRKTEADLKSIPLAKDWTICFKKNKAKD